MRLIFRTNSSCDFCSPSRSLVSLNLSKNPMRLQRTNNGVLKLQNSLFSAAFTLTVLFFSDTMFLQTMIRPEVKTELLLNAAIVVTLILMGLILKSLEFYPQFMRNNMVIFPLVLLLNQAWLHAGFVKTPYADMPRKQQQKIIISSVTLFPMLNLVMVILFSWFSSLNK